MRSSTVECTTPKPDIYWVRLNRVGSQIDSFVTCRHPDWKSGMSLHIFHFTIGEVRVYAVASVPSEKIRLHTHEAIDAYLKKRIGRMRMAQALTILIRERGVLVTDKERGYWKLLRSCERWLVNEGYVALEDTFTGLRLYSPSINITVKTS